jgi:hypothetical protein
LLTAFAGLRHSVGQRLGLGDVLLERDLVDGMMKIGQDVLEGRLVLQVEGEELVEDVAAFAHAGMSKDLSSGDHLEGDAAEAHGDLDMSVSGVLAGGFPGGSAHAEMGVAEDGRETGSWQGNGVILNTILNRRETGSEAKVGKGVSVLLPR